MKKIFFGIVALVAISFTTSCNGTGKGDVDIDSVNADTIVTAAPEANGVEADVTATISALSNALENNNVEQAQSLLQKAQAYIAKLQEEGKLDEAKSYIAKLQQFIREHKEKISQFTSNNSTLSNIVSAVDAIPVDVANATEDAKNAVVDAANDAANAASDAANSAVESGKKEAGKAIDNAANAVKSSLGI